MPDKKIISLQKRQDTNKQGIFKYVELLALILNFVIGLVIFYQLKENYKANKASIRTQLYQTEIQTSEEENSDGSQDFNSIWALIPPEVQNDKYGLKLLKMITNDKIALQSKNASELYNSMYGAATFENPQRRMDTRDLRRVFTYIQTLFYHVDNAFDATDEGILEPGEWETWKGLLREMHAHPLLLTVILQGYNNRYFNKNYARFIQEELCPEIIPTDVVDIEEFKRDRNFIRFFYPEMFQREWSNVLPKYGKKI